MGEEKKEEASKEEKKEEAASKEEKKEGNKDEEPQEIVLKVEMHCQACARKVAKSVKGFQGVEDVTADYRASKVVVKGKTADPLKVCERIQKKSGKKVEIISPLPKPKPPEEVKEETKEKPKVEKKEEPPAVVTVVLKIGMHCEACAQVLKKRIKKVKGVESVTTDLANDHVIVKGVLDPDMLVNLVYKKTHKQASIVKGEEKKEEEKKVEEKKEEKQEEKKEEEDTKTDIKKSEYLPPPKYYMDYTYPPPQMFSDENPHACSVM